MVAGETRLPDVLMHHISIRMSSLDLPTDASAAFNSGTDAQQCGVTAKAWGASGSLRPP